MYIKCIRVSEKFAVLFCCLNLLWMFYFSGLSLFAYIVN